MSKSEIIWHIYSDEILNDWYITFFVEGKEIEYQPRFLTKSEAIDFLHSLPGDVEVTAGQYKLN